MENIMSVIFEIGQKIADKGIFFGVWEPTDRNGRVLRKKFNLFAAPEDLTDNSGKRMLLLYNQTVKQVAGLRNWHGHDGGNFINDAALYIALKGNGYKGEWFIPTLDLLRGGDVDYHLVREGNNLYELRNTGDFRNTFAPYGTGFGSALWYWSCTVHRDYPTRVCDVWFRDGIRDWGRGGYPHHSCRPCRAEPLDI